MEKVKRLKRLVFDLIKDRYPSGCLSIKLKGMKEEEASDDVVEEILFSAIEMAYNERKLQAFYAILDGMFVKREMRKLVVRAVLTYQEEVECPTFDLSDIDLNNVQEESVKRALMLGAEEIVKGLPVDKNIYEYNSSKKQISSRYVFDGRSTLIEEIRLRIQV